MFVHTSTFRRFKFEGLRPKRRSSLRIVGSTTMGCRNKAEAISLKDELLELYKETGVKVKVDVNIDDKNDIYIELIAEPDGIEIELNDKLPEGWKHWPWNTEHRHYRTSIVTKQ